MNTLKEHTIIAEIQNEYQRIDDKWLKLHYYTFIILILFGFVIECALGAGLFISGYPEASLPVYIAKYILTPFMVNACFTIAAIIIMHISRLKKSVKVYSISLLFVGICFVYFSVHSIFTSLYLIFTVPVLLTLVYSDYCLTTVTALCSVAAKTVSELFVRWDAYKVSPFTSSHECAECILSALMLMAFYGVCIVVIRFLREKNAASIQKELERHLLEKQLITDELTQVLNRAALRTAFQAMQDDVSDTAYVFVMLDLDNFKTLNDTAGHGKGDECLREFGKILLKNCTDCEAFRFGGDEFCILCTNKSIEDVVEICKSIQNDLRQSPVNKLDVPLTTSIGISAYSNEISASELLKNTDAALYRSKTCKNSICVFERMDDIITEKSDFVQKDA